MEYCPICLVGKFSEVRHFALFGWTQRCCSVCTWCRSMRGLMRLMPVSSSMHTIVMVSSKARFQFMASVRFLDFQYSFSKSKFSANTKRLFSFSNKQYSGILPTFKPNIDEMRRVFDKFDANQDGKISQEEYKAIIRALGKPENTTIEVSKIFKVADLNKDGYIDFKEFMTLHNNGGGVRAMDIGNAFRAFDLDQDGKISAEEVHEMLRRLGESCSLADCKRMVSAVDTSGDGFINMDEFMTMMTRTMTRY